MNAYHMEQGIAARELAYRRLAMDRDEDKLIDTQSPPPAEADNNSRRSNLDSVVDTPSLLSDHGSDDHEAFRQATFHAPRPTSYNMDGFDECPLSRCESCSGSHTSGIPYTRRAELLTPTSPTRHYGRSAMWSQVSRRPERRSASRSSTTATNSWCGSLTSSE